ncbi:uncharacterized protein LOC117899050 isoform X1 [Drosophila subobscura]|uniref:uncharacterized protein LOC117899050 isoform X1 n=1 Tax=Drosophila subobscura TaxID=7241 RepID=UPI00155AF909|nr:uncharacterized protein LOC117899050 isoform X1 [Drosophila subobscura]XP_034664702.1 uncharacterized protein LOC117899050 isoform X1 [Drosophila subobscura]
MLPANGGDSKQSQVNRKMSIPNITIIPRKSAEEMRFLPIAAMPTKHNSSIHIGNVQSVKTNNNNNIHTALKSTLTMTPLNMNIVQASGVKTTSLKPGAVAATGSMIQLVPMSATGGATNHHPNLLAIITPSGKNAMISATPPHAQPIMIRPNPAISRLSHPSKGTFTINNSNGSTTVKASAVSSATKAVASRTLAEFPNTMAAMTAPAPAAPVPASVSATATAPVTVTLPVPAAGSVTAAAAAAVAKAVPSPQQQPISLIGGQPLKPRAPLILSKVAVDKLRIKFNQARVNPNAIIVSKALQQSSAQAEGKIQPTPITVNDMTRTCSTQPAASVESGSGSNSSSSNNQCIYPKKALPLPSSKDTAKPKTSAPTTAIGSSSNNNNNKEKDNKNKCPIKALPLSTSKDMSKAPSASSKMSPNPNPREITMQTVINGPPQKTEQKAEQKMEQKAESKPKPMAMAQPPATHKVKRSKSFVSPEEVAIMRAIQRRRYSVAKEPQVPAKEPQEPVKQPQAPVKQPQAPVKQPQAAAKQSQEHAKQTQEPVKKPQTYAKQTQAPAKEPQEPVKQPQEPEKQPNAAAKKPQAPVKQPQEPEKQSQAAAKQPQEPATEPQASKTEPVAPTKQPQAAETEPVAPAKEPVAPASDPVVSDKEDDAVVMLEDPPIVTITIDTDDSDDEGEKEQSAKLPPILSTAALTVTALPGSARRTSTPNSISTSTNTGTAPRGISSTGGSLSMLESRKNSRKNSSTSNGGTTMSSYRKSSHGSISISSSSCSLNSDVEEIVVPAKKRKEEPATHTKTQTISIVKAESVSNEDFERSLRCEESLVHSPESSGPRASSAKVPQRRPVPLPTQNGQHQAKAHKTTFVMIPTPPAGANAMSMKKAMLNNLQMLRWRPQQPASLQNSSLRFDINRYSLLQLNERCEPRHGPASYFERALFDRPGRRPTDSLHPLLYLCQRCNCHGPAADFLAPHYCSVGCVRRAQKRRMPAIVTSLNKMPKKVLTQQQQQQKKVEQLQHQRANRVELEQRRIVVAKRPFRWTDYMETHGPELTAPIHLFFNPFPRNANCFERGMKLEAIDPENCSLFCVCTVSEVHGYRLKLSFDGYSSMYDFWVNADSLDIFPPGWCESTNRVLQAPKGYCSQRWSWSRYLVKTNAKAAPRVLFPHLNHTPYKRENRFRRGMHLEAEDLNDTGKICVATVADILDERIRVHFNGWDDCYDFWVHISSPYIHPCGWHAGRQQLIVPPSYHNTVFSWEDFSRRKGGIAAPEDLFSPRQPMDFQARMKLEVVDQRNPCLIRPATVVTRKGYRVQLHLDCWPNEYYFWLEDDSPDLHPIGWCEATQHELESPPGFLQAPAQMPCDVDGCRGFGNAKRFNLNVHALPDCCPYAPVNWRQWRSKTVKPPRVAPDQISRVPLREPKKLSVGNMLPSPLSSFGKGYRREGLPELVIEAERVEPDNAQIVMEGECMMEDEAQIVIKQECIEEERPKLIVELEAKIEAKPEIKPKRRETIPKAKDIKEETKAVKEEAKPKPKEKIVKRQDETTAKSREAMPKQKEKETIPKAKEVKSTAKETKSTAKIVPKEPKPTHKETKATPKLKEAKPTPKEKPTKPTAQKAKETKGPAARKINSEEPVDPRCITIAMPIVKDYGPQLVHNYRLWQKNSAFALSTIKSNPLYWTNWDVYEYVERALDSRSIAQTIFDQDIDGRALLMLGHKDMSDHLQLKKGPAVKLFSHIVNLRIAVVCKFNMTCSGLDIFNFEAVDALNQKTVTKQRVEAKQIPQQQSQRKNPQQTMNSSSSYELVEESSDDDFDEDDDSEEAVGESVNTLELEGEQHDGVDDEEDDELDNEDFQSINPISLTHDDNDDDSDVVMLPPPLKARHCMTTAT